MLSILQLYCGWFVFWATYFTASVIFPTDQAITRPIAKITKEKVIKRVISNCIASAAIIPLVSYIPQMLFFPPTWYGYLLRWTLLPFIGEVWFYYTHRLMHHRWFYRWHADHHAFVQSHALAGLYCSTVEMLLVNQLAMAIPYQLVGLSLIEIIIANIYVAVTTLKGHAGLYFRDDLPKWMPKSFVSALDHDIHHRVMTCNFGIMYLLDRIHGTYQPALRSL